MAIPSERKRALVARWIENTILTTDNARKIDLHEYWRTDNPDGSYKRYVWEWSRSLTRSLGAGIADAIADASDDRSVAQKRGDAIDKVEALIRQGRFGNEGYLRTYEMKEGS